MYLTPAVFGMVAAMSSGAMFAGLSVADGDVPLSNAAVSLNGTTLLGDGQGSYGHFELSPGVIRLGDNELNVKAAGFEPLTLRFVVPRPVSLLAPASGAQLRAGTSTQISWEASAGATSYTVRLFPDEQGPGSEPDYVMGTSANVLVPGTTGPATVQVAASGMSLIGRSFLLVEAQTERSVEIIP